MAAWRPSWIFRFPDSNFSLALNIKSKLKCHITCVYGKEPIDFQQCHFQNGRLAGILEFAISGLCRWHAFWNVTRACLEFQFQISCACLCLWAEAYWFQRCPFQNGCLVAIFAFSVSGLTSVWHWILSQNFSCTLQVCMERSLLILRYVTFKMATWWPYWIFLFSDSNLSLALNFKSKLLQHISCVYW